MRFTDKFGNTYMVENICLVTNTVKCNSWNIHNVQYPASICFGEFVENTKYDLSDCESLVEFVKKNIERTFQPSSLDWHALTDPALYD